MRQWRGDGIQPYPRGRNRIKIITFRNGITVGAVHTCNTTKNLKSTLKMPTIGTLLETKKPIATSHSYRSEFGDMLDQFLGRINPDREKAGYTKFNHARLATELKRAKIPPSYLYTFYKNCEQARDFSRFFHWFLRERRKTIAAQKLSTPR